MATHVDCCQIVQPLSQCKQKAPLAPRPRHHRGLLDRHLIKKDKPLDDEEEELINRRKLTSTRREALSLYRDILRATRFFMWPDSNGILWRDTLRHNARKEFEEARFENDPEIVTRLLIGGREAVYSALVKLTNQIQKDRGGGGYPL